MRSELQRIKAAMAAGEHTDGDLATAVELWEEAEIALASIPKSLEEAAEIKSALAGAIALFRECDVETPDAGEKFLNGFARLKVSWERAQGCKACREVGAWHCAYPDECGNMRASSGD